MNIDYDKIYVSLNDFANNIMKMVRIQYGLYVSNIDEIPLENFIVIEPPTQKDVEFFSKQNGAMTTQEYNVYNVPSAHGGRTKNDGKIHIYPYSPNSFANCKNDDDIIEICKKDIIIHEIFHYFIRPNINYNEQSIESEFSHFLIEGLVQGYAESFALKNNLPMPNSNYSKNVNAASALLNGMPEGTDINFEVFNSSINELITKSSEGAGLLERYKENKKFYQKINEIISRSSSIANFTPEVVNSIKRYYANIDDHEQVVNDMKDKIQTIFGDKEELCQEFMGELDELTINNKEETKEKQQSIEQEGPKLVRDLPTNANNSSQTSSNEGKINLKLALIAAAFILVVCIIGILLFQIS